MTGIRHWSTPDYTRVAIDVEDEVKYEAGRVPNPDRIFFDLADTKLASVLVGKSFDVQDGFLKKIRVAQYQPGATRVVLEVADVSDYSAFLLPNPYRLIIDIHGRQPQSQTLIAKANSASSAANVEGTVTSVAKEKSFRSVEKANETDRAVTPPAASASAKKTAASADDSAGTTQPAQPATTASSKKAAVHKVVVDDNDDSADEIAPPSEHTTKTACGETERPALRRTEGHQRPGAEGDDRTYDRSDCRSRRAARQGFQEQGFQEGHQDRVDDYANRARG